MSTPNSGIGSIVTFGTLVLMVAVATIALGEGKVVEPSDSTFLAHMEADQRYDEFKQRHRESRQWYQRAVISRGDSETMTDDELRAFLTRVTDEELERAESRRRNGTRARVGGPRSR